MLLYNIFIIICLQYLIIISLQESIKSEFVDQSISSDPSRSTSVPPPVPAPADWVRKERIGKKGEFRYF